MNDSFGRVREKGLAQWRLEQGGIILDDTMITHKTVDPFIYVLTYTSDFDFQTENESFDIDQDQKEISALDEKVSETNSLLRESLKKEHDKGDNSSVITSLNDVVSTAVTNIQSCVASAELNIVSKFQQNQSLDSTQQMYAEHDNLRNIISSGNVDNTEIIMKVLEKLEKINESLVIINNKTDRLTEQAGRQDVKQSVNKVNNQSNNIGPTLSSIRLPSKDDDEHKSLYSKGKK